MSTSFDDVRLPEDIEQGAKGGPAYQTNIIALSSGVEQRVGNWEQAKAPWDIGYGIMDQDDYALVEAFFHGRRGRLRGFRFKDWHDFEGTAEPIGTGNGTLRTFLLSKTYDDDANPYVRRITRPVTGTVVVYLDGTPADPTTYDVHVAGGYIVFHATHAPAGGVEVTADFEFDIPVRFDIDNFDMVLYWIKAGEVPSIPIIEIRDLVNAAPTVALANVVATLSDSTSTASHVFVADVVVTDDPFGVNSLSLSGADAAFFELVGTLDEDGGGVKVYLRAGTVLDGALKASYAYTVNVSDTSVSSVISGTASSTLAITQAAQAPHVALSGITASFPWNQNVSVHLKVATVNVTQHGTGGTNVLSLTGANASSFEFVGTTSASGNYTCDLYIKSGVTTPVDSNPANAITYNVTVNVSNASFASPPQDTKTLAVVFGVAPASLTDDVPGTRNYTVPQYQTMVIKLWGGGAGASGLNAIGHDGTETSIAAMSLHAPGGKVSPLTLANGDFDAEGGLGGVSTGGDVHTAGNTGGTGLHKVKPASSTVTSGKGGDAPGTGGAGGAAVTATAPTAPSPLSQPTPPTDSPANSTHVNGNAGTTPGGGGSGSASSYYSAVLTLALGYTWTLYVSARPGGGSGSYDEKTFVRGVTPGAPNPGDVISYTVGSKGLGGSDSASGGDGGAARLQITVS
jgi:uncharacterized protein (TIGR02217 family)